MSIIREINAQFAIPNWQNSSAVVRFLIVVLISVLYLPLIDHSPLTYSAQIYRHASWAFPLSFIMIIKDIFVQRFFPSLLKTQYSVLMIYLSQIVVFFIFEFFIFKETTNWVQHLALFNLYTLSFMYIEATRRSNLTPAISEARLNALTARIRPHFLFNSLNAAISLIRLRPYDAETLLENLANLFRAQLRDSSQSSTLGQEIEWAQEYIAIEQIRMGHTRVQVMWQHHAPDDAETPHLLLQPLLENAVFHGIESTHRPGMISVLTKLHKSAIYIRIENPYSPQENHHKSHRGNSMALQNLKERLALMYDNDAKIQSRQLDGSFRVDIRLPYRKRTSDVVRLFG